MGGFEVWQEFGHVAFVFGEAYEATDRVGLAGSGATALEFLSSNLAGGHTHRRGPGADRLKIDVERSRTLKLAQSTDAVANESEEDWKFRPAGDSMLMLQLGRRKELDADPLRRRSDGLQVESRRFDGTDHRLRCAFEEDEIRNVSQGKPADALEFGLSATGPESFARESSECEDEIR